MHYRIRILEPDEHDIYQHYIKAHPQSSIYHHIAWQRALSSAFPHIQCQNVACFNDKNELSGVIPGVISNPVFSRKRFISLPFAMYATPLFNSETDLKLLLEHLSEQLKPGGIELRSDAEFSLAEVQKFTINRQYLSHTLNLSNSLDSLFESFGKTAIQQRIKKAEKQPYSIDVRTDEESIKAFYKLYFSHRKSIGLPPVPYTFFYHLWYEFSKLGLIKIQLLKLNEQTISAMILLFWKGVAIDEYAATSFEYRSMHPDHHMIWHAIKRAKESGCQLFDFGRTYVFHSGLLKFKDSWGTQRKPLYYYYYPQIQSISNKKRDGVKLKLFKSVIRVLPPRVFALSGKLLYRYFH